MGKRDLAERGTLVVAPYRMEDLCEQVGVDGRARRVQIGTGVKALQGLVELVSREVGQAACKPVGQLPCATITGVLPAVRADRRDDPVIRMAIGHRPVVCQTVSATPLSPRARPADLAGLADVALVRASLGVDR